MAFTDYYRVLGLPHFYVTPEEVQEAYHKRKDFFHPDNRNVTKDFSDIITPQLEIAYAVLIDPSRKREYDKVLSLYVNEPLRETTPVKTKQKEKSGFWKKAAHYAPVIVSTSLAVAVVGLAAFGVYSQYRQTPPTVPAVSSSAPAKTDPPKVSGKTAPENSVTVQPPKLIIAEDKPKVNIPALEKQALPRPDNGHVFTNTGKNNCSELCIETLSGRDYLIKLEGIDAENRVVIFYARGGYGTIADVTPGTYILKYACGDGNSWYGPLSGQRFGKDTVYAKADDTFTFTETEGWTVELYFHVDGNLRETHISKNEF